MMNHQYQVSVFQAERVQKLRNVRIHSPSIIQLITGKKNLFYKESVVELSRSTILLCAESTLLNFENYPLQGRFSSRMFSFYCQPTEQMLKISKSNAIIKDRKQIYPLDEALQDTLNALYSFNLKIISKETQTFWLMGLYQQLAERGMLHNLFSDNSESFTQQLSRYFSDFPSKDHHLEHVSEEFAMSRATLIRKLKKEGTQYRNVLADVRLNHALYLAQNGCNNIALLSKLCGYKSETRFSLRFKDKFGLTPKAYVSTIGEQET